MAQSSSLSKLQVVRPVVHIVVVNFLFYAGTVIMLPLLMDIMVDALCPGDSDCNEVVLMTGALQFGVGVGTVFVAPVLGSLSDDRGRRLGYLFVLFPAILPPALLAISRSAVMVYAWFVVMLISAILRDSGLIPNTLAYVADVLDERRRSVAVGCAMSAISLGAFTGTIAAMLFSAEQALWVATALQATSAIYMVLFVKESHERKLLLPLESQPESSAKLLPKPDLRRQRSKLRESVTTIWSCKQLRIAAAVDFLNNIAVAGSQSICLYYLKAVFDFGQKEYSVLLLAAGLMLGIGQLLFYPALVHFCGERFTLWVGVSGAALHYFLFGVAWTNWVPYVAGGVAMFYGFITPALGTIVSKAVDSDQQGKVQGIMGGARSAAAIISPLVITPLAAVALSENAPTYLRGLPFYVCTAAELVGFLFALGMPTLPSSDKATDYIQAPSSPADDSVIETGSNPDTPSPTNNRQAPPIDPAQADQAVGTPHAHHSEWVPQS